ncbi:MAG TPA: HAD-IC family P-type ATPase, partial [Hanamia sp.]
MMQWHTLSIPEVLKSLDTNEKGLSTIEAREKLKQTGPNELEEGKKKSVVKMLLSQFKDVMILILTAAAIISGFIGDFTDTVVIIMIVLLNAILGFYQEYRADKAMQALKKMSVVQAKVLRNKQMTTLPATKLVPGDVVILETGNAVPADVRLIESIHLKTEEAALTGESQPIHKITYPLDTDELPVGDKKNMAFKGTFVSGGRGKGVVVATGMQTELGRIAEMLQQKETLTPLQQRVNSFGKYLSALVLAICVLFFIAGWLRGEELVRMALTSISLAV